MFPYENVILIDRTSKISIYKQIAHSLSRAIREGTLQASSKLPGTRELAKSLGVHRKTVIAAYDELDAQGWVEIQPRKPVRVSDKVPTLNPQRWSSTSAIRSYDNDFSLSFRQSTCEQGDPNTKPIPDIIIDDGHPDVRLSPIDDLLKTYRSYTSRKHMIKNAQIGADQGTLALREQIASYLSHTRGLNIATDNIIVTHGAQMSIYLAAKMLLDKGSTIIVGQPNYPLANKTFAETGANLMEVPVDEHGIDTAAIETLCRTKKIDAVYVIPHHHYPTTVTLSVERRMELLELSNTYAFTIIEDDYDYEYHYDSSPYLPLASGRHQGNIIYIGSFSKILDPSLRMGFMIAPKNFIKQCVALRRTIDVGGDGYMQNALASLIKDDELNRHIKKAKKVYQQRRDFLDQLMLKHLRQYISYSLPQGGMAIWVKLNSDYPIELLIDENRLKIIRTDSNQNAFRFGFASMNEKELTEVVSMLQQILALKPKVSHK